MSLFTSTFNKVLYIGAGLDISSLNTLNMVIHNINEFILIDVLPRSEFDSYCEFDTMWYRKSFYDNLINECNLLNFKLLNQTCLNDSYIDESLYDKNVFHHMNPTLLLFKNEATNQTLKYYISTNILFFMNSELEQDIRSSTILFNRGYHPDEIIFKYFDNLKIFIGSEYTCYSYNDEIDCHNIINKMINLADDNMLLFFSEYYLLINSELLQCDDIYHINDINVLHRKVIEGASNINIAI